MISIRRKLLIQIGSIILLFILLLYLANTFFLENIYTQSTKNKIIDIYDELNTMDVEDIDSESLYDIAFGSRTFVEIVIINEETNELILPMNPFISESQVRPNTEIVKLPPLELVDPDDREVINESVNMIRFEDPKKRATFFALIGHLDNGLRVEVRVPLSSISQNVAFFNQFILVTGAIIMVITFAAANFISKYFTKPIENMSKVTDHIKNLDFSETCEVITNDEIGQLAENINEMSYALKDNIDNLEDSNKRLQDQVDERIKIDEQRKTLLNNVSHELKTPLSLVQGYSEGLKLNLHKNAEKTDFYCEVIMDEAKKMDLLVSQLLDINHIQFGDFPLHKETLDGKDFIAHIIKKQEPLLLEDNVNFTKDFGPFDDKDFNLSVDALRTEQIITNLLGNACAYVDDQSIIQLKLDSVDDIHLRLTISNTYQQVDADELDNWWNSFYKADKARTRENGGYGLGLSIIKAIQEADDNAYGVYYDQGMIHFYVEFDVA